MSRKWKIILGIFLFIFTFGIGLSIFATFRAWDKVKTIQTQLDKKESEVTNKPQEEPIPDNSKDPENPKPKPDDKPNNDNPSQNEPSEPNSDKNDNDSTPSIPITPKPEPSKPDSSNKPIQTPTPNPPSQTPPTNDTNSSNNPTLPELDKNESTNTPTQKPTPPITGDSTSLEMQKSLLKYLDKYDFVKNTTQYQDHFLNTNGLIFNEVKIRNNTYQLIRNAILKTNTYNEKTMSLTIKIRYQLHKNNKSIRLWIQWSTKLKDIGFNVVKNYYDKIIITLN